MPWREVTRGEGIFTQAIYPCYTPNGALQAKAGGLHLISELIVNDKGIDSEALGAISLWARE